MQNKKEDIDKCLNCTKPECNDCLNKTYSNIDRTEYFRDYYKRLTPKQKEQRRINNRKWYKAHKEEIKGSRREYQHEYYLKRKAERENAKAV